MPMDLDFGADKTLRNILDSITQGVSIHGANKELLYLNPAMAKITGGLTKMGTPLSEVQSRHRLFTETGVEVDPADFPISKAYRGEDTRGVMFEYVGVNGAHFWLNTTCVRILDTSGNLLCVLTVISDRTRRKNRDDKLRFMVESAKILSLTADFRQRLIEKAKLTVPALADWCAIDILIGDDAIERTAVIHSDPKKIDYIKELEKHFPTDPKAPNSVRNLIKENRAQFIPVITDEMIKQGAKSPEHLEAIRKLNLKSIMTIPIAARGRGLGAMTLAYAESGRMYTEDDFRFFQEFGYHIGVILDNARLFEEVEKRDTAKDLFLASLSHELRNPLAPIKSSLELLKFKDLLPDVREEIEVIEHQFDHMARLLNDLLDVSRFTSAKISISPRPIDLRKLMERALRATDALLRTADITMHFTYPSSAIFVKADETRLEQAITNLMSNAAKFTPAGGSIWVDVERVDANVVIKIRDNGAGIAPEDLPNIFEMYYQSRRAANVNSGLGIGLLLVKQIVGLHGGTITAASEGVGLGSEFTITIPLTDAPKDLPKEAAPKDAIAAKRVAIIDDNAQAADALARLLTKLGAKTEAFYSAHETLAREDLAAFDIFLIDIGMPQIDGYALVKVLRERGLTQPMIALTGYGMADDKQRALSAGFTAHLTKPIGLQDIRDTFASLF